MAILFIVGLVITLFLLFLFLIFHQPKIVTKVDGTIIKIRRRYGNKAIVDYCEPSGIAFRFDAYWVSSSQEGENVLRVEFPTELYIPEIGERKQEAIERLDIPKTPSMQMSSTQRDEVKNKVSHALRNLKIAHEFLAPRRSGWTSFEDGKEIYRMTCLSEVAQEI
jgi:hypothetical protein